MQEPKIEIENSDSSKEKLAERLAAYQRFLSELNKKDITPYNVSKNTGIATSTLSDWKNGKSMPKPDKMKKIANYLSVSMEYLLTGDDFKYSEEDALLDIHISEDVELKEAIKKYYTLDDKKKKHVIELINLLSEN